MIFLLLISLRFSPSFARVPIEFSLSVFTDDYVGLKATYAKDNYGEIILHTRKPLWNSEINTYVHNFGCRVKKASNRNFIVVRSASHTDEATEVVNGVRDTATFDSANSICIRHGKVRGQSKQEYIKHDDDETPYLF